MAAVDTRTVYQPIHPDILPKLLPEYVEFHNKVTAYAPAVHTVPWDPAVRKGPPVIGGMRIFTPEGTPPADGWPVFLFFHGGGWVLGNINTENAFSTNMCTRAKCVVVSVDYRLAPEEKYPKAVHDAEEALYWVRDHGKAELNVNLSKFAVGGSSSGGNLAAIVAHKAALASPPIPLSFQLLVVPVTDNTADPTTTKYKSWVENANTPSLSPAKMVWYKQNYSPNPEDWTKWDNSPIFGPDEAFKRAPPTWICVAELDILRDEGIAYGEKLKSFGVPVETVVYKGAPHPIMAMDGVLKIGQQLVSDAAAALAKAFGTS